MNEKSDDFLAISTISLLCINSVRDFNLVCPTILGSNVFKILRGDRERLFYWAHFLVWPMGGGLMGETCVSCLFKGSGSVYLIDNKNVEFIYFQILKI